MGIPYSREIEAVGPLIAEASITLIAVRAAIVAHILLFWLLTIAVIVLLVTMNPDLEDERKALVTPTVKWVCSWAMEVKSMREEMETPLQQRAEDGKAIKVDKI